MSSSYAAYAFGGGQGGRREQAAVAVVAAAGGRLRINQGRNPDVNLQCIGIRGRLLSLLASRGVRRAMCHLASTLTHI